MSKTTKRQTKEMSLDQQVQAIRDAWYQQNIDLSENGVIADSPGWVKEVYSDHVIVESTVGLYKIPYGKDAEGVITFGERVKVEIEYVPAKAGALALYKDKAGDWRWVGWVTNQYRDNDRPREILSAKAHERFIAKADELGKYPELWMWHVPDSKAGAADWLGFADGFLIASGRFDKDKAGVAETLAKSTDQLTMSHGFVRLKHDPESVVTDDYWMFECSITPKGVEANPWTEFRVIGKGADDMPLSEAKKAFLGKYLPAEVIADIENNTKSLKEAAEAAGVDFKVVEGADDAAGTEPTGEKAAPTTPTTSTESTTPSIDVKALAEALAPALAEKYALKGLSDTVTALKEAASRQASLEEKIAGLEAQIKEIQKSEDEKVAKAMTPKIADTYSWMTNGAFVASQSKETKLDDAKPEDQKLKSAGPSYFEEMVGRIAGA